MTNPDDRDEGDEDTDRVSLAPLDPEDALRALLAVDPHAVPADTDEDHPSDSGR